MSRARRWGAGSFLTVVGVVSLFAVGCASEAQRDGEVLGKKSQPIISGVASPSNQDFVLQLGLETDGKIDALCSSSLVAKNLLLTARHCVGDLDGTTDPANPTMTSTFDAGRFAIYTGQDGPRQIEQKAAPAARGAQVITAKTNSLFPDIALIVLDKPIDDAPLAHIRLKQAVKKAETVNVVGYGMNENNSFDPIRMEKPNMKVLAIAPEVTTFHQLNPGEFVFGEAACFGDSGGPAISATSNAVLGVASRVNSGQEGTQAEPNKPCVGTGTEDVYTSLEPFKDIITTAFKAAGATPLLEGEPDPETTPSKSSGTKTTTPASDEGDDGAAASKSPRRSSSASSVQSSGCSMTASSSATPSALAALGLAFVAFAARRRRQG